MAVIKENTIYIRPLQIDDAEGNLKLQSENRDFFELFSMTRACDFYTIEGQRKRIEISKYWKKDQEYHFLNLYGYGPYINRNDRPLSDHSRLPSKCVHRLFFR